MSIQLSESCVRSIYNTTRIRSYAAFRLSRLYHLRRRPEAVQYNKKSLLTCPGDRHPIYYTTLALQSSPLLPDDALVDSKTRFNTILQDPKSILELWNVYLAIRSKAPITTNEYEQLMTLLHSRAQETRRSVNWQRIIRVYQDATEHTKSMMLMGIAAYGRTGQFEKARETFNQVKDKGWADEVAYWHMLEASLNTSQDKDARQVMRDGKDVMGDEMVNRCLDRYVDVCIKKKNVARAMDIVQEWMPTHPTDRLATSLYTGYAQLMKRNGGLLHEVEGDLETFVGEFGRRSSISLPHSVRVLFTTTHLATLVDIWTKSSADRIPSQKTYERLLAIYAAQEDLPRVKDVMAVMQQRDIEPTQQTLNALLKTSIATPSYTKALYKAFNLSNKLCKESYAAFIQAFANAGDLESAQRVAMHMQRRPFTIGTSSHMVIVQGWVRQGQVEKAEAWLKRVKYAAAVKDRCQAALDPYAVVMEGYLQHGEWNKCVKLLDSVQKKAPMAHQNRRIVKAALAARLARGDFDGGERMLLHKQIEFSAVTVIRIIQTLLDLKVKSMYSVSGRSAVRGLEMMEQKLKIQISATGVSRLIDKLGERGDIRAAYDLYKRTRNHSQPIFRSMMEAAINNNNVAMAEKVAYHMNRTGREHKHQACPTLSSYNMLLNAYASRKPEPHLVRMTRTFRRMLADGYKPDVTTYNTLIKAFVQMDNQGAAHSVFQEMVAAGHRPDSWTVNTLIQGWISQLDWNSVEQFIGEVKQSGHVLDVVTFNLMVEGLLRLDRHQIQAIQLLKRQSCWSKLKQQEAPKNPLPSETVWEIFESTVGLSWTTTTTTTGWSKADVDSTKQACRQLLQQQQGQPLQVSKNGVFYSLFGLTKPDEVTFKLFMKAFQNANDPESAAKIHQYWMACR
ncbi:hypothetical protein BJV82DRAFT_602471 [Fennellomyces sp. T-0311]|nr:hypothetical protein BJV82DRAFT_602471 [Fennellomyces sp. T-0311]